MSRSVTGRLQYVVPATGRRCIRIESVVTCRRRMITLSSEPDRLGFVGFDQHSGYSSVVFSAREWRAIGFGR